jgi:hypothetical protein
MFLPEGRLISMVTAGQPRPAATVPEQAAAFGSMLAYAGTYRDEGHRFVARVDLAWDERWVGSEQIRYYTIEGDSLSIETAPQLTLEGGPEAAARAIVTWRREASGNVQSCPQLR